MVWEVKKLNQIGTIFSGNSINAKTKKEKYLNIDSGMSYVATKDVSYNSIINYNNGVKIPNIEVSNFRVAHKNSILICAEGGSAGRKLAFNTQDICFVNKLFALEPFEFMEPRYVFYFYHTSDFQEQFKSKITGLIGGVSMGKFKEIKIPVPPLLIQKKIVKILDEAFEKISKAKENSEQNLKNAKEVFESYLQSVFENKGEVWEEKKLGDFLKLEYGKPLDKSKRNPDGKYPVYGANGEKDRTDEFYYDKNSIIVGRKGSAGEINLTESKFWPLDVTYFVTFDNKKYDLMFIYHILNKLKLTSLAKGVKPGINRNDVYAINVSYPNIEKQKKIVSKLDSLSAETKKLESIYARKLSNLEELKQSILQKAFNGELTEVLV
jgi:type I restriction enzyme, S subunit